MPDRSHRSDNAILTIPALIPETTGARYQESRADKGGFHGHG